MYRITEVDHVGVQKYGYTYSDEGDPLTQSDLTTPVNNEGYDYDGMHRLNTMNRGPQGMPDFSQSWTLDKVGNWTSWNDNGTNETRTHNALNQLTQKGAAACVYDGKGNQVDDGERFTMVYDPNNRLKEVRDRATGETVVTCKYDALGRRVERNVLKPVEYQTGGLTRYYYAGQRIVEEYASAEGGDSLQAVYTYGQYIDEPLSMDHVPTSQPTSQPASGGTGILPVTENTPTPVVVVSPTATALPSATQSSVLTPLPSASVPAVTSVVNIPTATVIPTNTAELLPTIPPDPYATEAAAMLTPVPTDTPVALQTVPPDAIGTQAAEMYVTPAPTVVSTALPLATTNNELLVTNTPNPTVTPVQALATTSQPTLERYYYHANRLYNVAALTDSQGNVVERYQYNAYGLCTTFNANYELPLTFSRLGNPFTFTGRELDPETDMMYYRRRTYSTRQGRFVQKDPIEYWGGINLYTYVKNNSISHVDPYGLKICCAEEKPLWQALGYASLEACMKAGLPASLSGIVPPYLAGDVYGALEEGFGAGLFDDSFANSGVEDVVVGGTAAAYSSSFSFGAAAAVAWKTGIMFQGINLSFHYLTQCSRIGCTKKGTISYYGWREDYYFCGIWYRSEGEIIEACDKFWSSHEDWTGGPPTIPTPIEWMLQHSSFID